MDRYGSLVSSRVFFFFFFFFLCLGKGDNFPVLILESLTFFFSNFDSRILILFRKFFIGVIRHIFRNLREKGELERIIGRWCYLFRNITRNQLEISEYNSKRFNLKILSEKRIGISSSSSGRPTSNISPVISIHARK